MTDEDKLEILNFYRTASRERGKSSLSAVMKGFLSEEIQEDLRKGYTFKKIIEEKSKKYDIEINYHSAKSWFKRNILKDTKTQNQAPQNTSENTEEVTPTLAEKSQAELLEKKAASVSEKVDQPATPKKEKAEPEEEANPWEKTEAPEEVKIKTSSEVKEEYAKNNKKAAL